MSDYSLPKRFPIVEGDVGTDAYTDRYVDWLEQRLHDARDLNAHLKISEAGWLTELSKVRVKLAEAQAEIARLTQFWSRLDVGVGL